MAFNRPTPSPKLPLNASLPSFSLPNVDGQTITQDYFKDAKAALVVFTCNHCPYVKGSEEMLLSTLSEYQSIGLKTVLISSNDAVQYPDDGPAKMKEKAATWPIKIPYLYDQSQQVARTFDAACTPECYLFARNTAGALVLAYHGTINDSPKDKTLAKKNFIGQAIAQVLQTGKADPAYIHPLGCTIKWTL